MGEPVVLTCANRSSTSVPQVRADGSELRAIPMGYCLRACRNWTNVPTHPYLCQHHGGRSMQVAHFLRHQGFAHVANIYRISGAGP